MHNYKVTHGDYSMAESSRNGELAELADCSLSIIQKTDVSEKFISLEKFTIKFVLLEMTFPTRSKNNLKRIESRTWLG